MSDELPWFKLYARETLADSNFSGWSLEERGAWLTLILHNWLDGELPSDEAALARLLHVHHADLRGLWSAVGSRFVLHPDRPGKLTSPRLEKERDAAHELAKKRGTAGKKGATSRWDKVKSKHGKRMANASGCHPVAIPGASVCHTDPDTDPDPDSGKGLDTDPASQKTGRLAELESGLMEVASKLGAHYRRPGPLGVGKDWNRVCASFGRYLETVGVDALVSECVRLAAEKSVEPANLSWWCGWLDTVPDSALKAAVAR